MVFSFKLIVKTTYHSTDFTGSLAVDKFKFTTNEDCARFPPESDPVLTTTPIPTTTTGPTEPPDGNIMDQK